MIPLALATSGPHFECNHQKEACEAVANEPDDIERDTPTRPASYNAIAVMGTNTTSVSAASSLSFTGSLAAVPFGPSFSKGR